MRRVFTIVSTATISAAITSAFWLVAFNSGEGEAEAASDSRAVPAAAAQVGLADAVEVGPTGMVIPVAGIRASQLADTFTHARAGGARVHDAIDIMAPSGTPVLAAAPGRLEKLFFSKGGGGITAYVRSLDGKWSYYYAHLRDYAPGLIEGMPIRRGQKLGHVGYSGNANPAGPHLHFAVNRMSKGDGFWQGSPVNPYPLLTGK